VSVGRDPPNSTRQGFNESHTSTLTSESVIRAFNEALRSADSEIRKTAAVASKQEIFEADLEEAVKTTGFEGPPRRPLHGLARPELQAARP
jgi:hypothetical protein